MVVKQVINTYKNIFTFAQLTLDWNIFARLSAKKKTLQREAIFVNKNRTVRRLWSFLWETDAWKKFRGFESKLTRRGGIQIVFWVHFEHFMLVFIVLSFP